MKKSMIKAATGFRRMTAEAVFNTSQAIYNALNGNDKISAPPSPFDLPTLLAANQALSAANVAALDGSKQAIALKSHCQDVVVNILDQLAVYVQANCNGDITTFLTSGFKAKSSTKAQATTASEAIRYVESGPKSGQASAKLVADPKAGAYEIRFAPVPAGGVPTDWTIHPVVNLRSATVVPGLTPGTTYAFQARSVTASGYSDWSDSVTLVAQ